MEVGLQQENTLNFEGFLETLQDTIKSFVESQNTDVADILLSAEERIHLQDGDPAVNQREWEVVLRIFSSSILLSIKWDEHVGKLVGRLTKLKHFNGIDEDEKKALLWEIVFDGIMEATGPQRLRKTDKRSRIISDILKIGYLSNPLRDRTGRERSVDPSMLDFSTLSKLRAKTTEEEILDEASQECLLDEIEDALNSLPEHLRQIVYYKYMRDWSQEKIADALGKSQGTISRDLEEARIRLRQPEISIDSE